MEENKKMNSEFRDLEKSPVSMLVPHLHSSDPGRGNCITLMEETPGFGSAGAVAQPWQDSSCPALPHPKTWGLEWPQLHILAHAAALPRGTGISEPALLNPDWLHSSSPVQEVLVLPSPPWGGSTQPPQQSPAPLQWPYQFICTGVAPC